MKIQKTGRTWSIVSPAGTIIEGGYFSKVAAEQALELYLAEVRAAKALIAQQAAQKERGK